MTPPTNPVDLPADPKAWTDDHCNEALRRIADHELSIAAAKIKYNSHLARIKADYEVVRAQHLAGIKAFVRQLKAAGQRLKKSWTQKTRKLPWGMIRFRKNPRSLALKKTSTIEAALLWLEIFHPDCVRTEKFVNLEVLERKHDDIIDSAGYRWTKPKENFDHKTKITLDAEAAGDGAKQ